MPISLARNPADREAGLQPVEAKPEDRRASERVKRARVARAVHGNAKLTAADVGKIRAIERIRPEVRGRSPRIRRRGEHGKLHRQGRDLEAPGLADQGCRLERLARLLLCKPLRRQLA